MKKELLMASALASTLGAASVAEAVTSTMSGNHRVGVEFDSPNGTAVDTVDIDHAVHWILQRSDIPSWRT